MKTPSQKQERRVAERFGGRTTPGSGNTWARKNDVRNSTTSFEMKYTGKKQYTLKASELEKGQMHALIDGRDFVFGIEMNGRNWVVISEDDYAELKQPIHIHPESDVVLQIDGFPSQSLLKGYSLTITPGKATVHGS